MLNLPNAAAVAVQATLWVALSSPWAALANAAPAKTATQSQTTPRLHEGDLVRLRSGGSVLTVKSASDNWVICTWFDDYGELQSTAFPIAMIAGPLTPSPDDAKPQTNGQMSPSSPWAALADAAPANTATKRQTTPLLHEGDLVRLRSGGPAMTIESVGENWVVCSWNEGGYGAQSAGFPIAIIAGPLTLSPDEANPQTNGQMSPSSPWAALADAPPANTATQSQTTPRLHEGDLVRLPHRMAERGRRDTDEGAQIGEVSPVHS